MVLFMSWYVIRVISGKEGSVCKDLMALSSAVDSVIVNDAISPSKVVQVAGKPPVSQRIFSGYVYLSAVMSPVMRDKVKSVRGVINFLGDGKLPVPISDDEMVRVVSAATISDSIDSNILKKGDAVKIVGGPLDSFVGTIDELSNNKIFDDTIIKVCIAIFGRTSIVEVEASKIQKIE